MKKKELQETKDCAAKNEEEMFLLFNQIQELSKSLDTNEEIVIELRDEKLKLKRKIRELFVKIERQNILINNNKYDNIDHLKNEFEHLSNKVKELNSENKDLEMLIALLEDEEIVTFQNGRYCDEIREVIMELLSLNVSMNKVNDVIRVVIQKLAKKDVGKLPSAGVKSRLMQEALIIAQFQVAEAMLLSKDNLSGNCLHGDGTGKYHKHYQNFQITTSHGKTLSFGLSEVAGGDAATVLKNFTATIDDICDVLNENNKEYNYASLISTIKSTMSDLGPINPLFNSQLKSLREQLLPKVIGNWESLTESQKADMTDMGNFFCKLHLLANFATETDKVLNSFEKMILSDDYDTVFAFNSAKESSVARLVRTSCKAFHVRGSDECGVASYFNSFFIRTI